MEISYVFLACTLAGIVYGQSKVTQSEDGSSGTIKFSTPDLNDEEAHSPWMPDQLRCDACRVVALQLYEKFDKFNAMHKHYKYSIPESELLDITEETCSDKNIFENYGLKEVNKMHRLTGPGLETADVPGMMQGGGRWPGRLMDMCEQYMGNIGEVEVYNAYKRNPKSRKQFEDYLCNGEAQKKECVAPRDTEKKDEL